METIIGREAEMKRLNTALEGNKPEFVALYGRRRVGKTFLINQMYKNQFAFKMTGVIEGKLKDQFTAFADAMYDYGFTISQQPKDWMQAFIMLKHALKKKVESGERCVIFIDELPALDAEGSNVASAVGYFWNSWACQYNNIIFIKDFIMRYSRTTKHLIEVRFQEFYLVINYLIYIFPRIIYDFSIWGCIFSWDIHKHPFHIFIVEYYINMPRVFVNIRIFEIGFND